MGRWYCRLADYLALQHVYGNGFGESASHVDSDPDSSLH
jgi:hypothetical protein